jgi:uncharacterized RDD family membrane protein YckC
MSNFDILTSQNVSVNYNVAGVGNRIAASAIDYAFVGTWIFFLSVVVQLNLHVTNPFVLVVLYSPVVFYQLLMEIFFNGQSAGKMMMKIRVMKTDGSAPSVVAYLLRWMFRLIDITFSMGSIAVVTIAFTEKAQRLGDLAAGTTVIRLNSKTKLGELVQVAKDDNYQPLFSEVVALNDQDISLLKKVLYKRSETKDLLLADKMAMHIKKATGITSEMDDLKFLRTILADYEFYALQDKTIL